MRLWQNDIIHTPRGVSETHPYQETETYYYYYYRNPPLGQTSSIRARGEKTLRGGNLSGEGQHYFQCRLSIHYANWNVNGMRAY